MLSSARFRQARKIIPLVAVLSAAAGAAYGTLVASEPARGALQGMVSAALIATPAALFEVAVMRGPWGFRLRRSSFTTIVLVRSLAYLAAILCGLLIGDALFGRPRYSLVPLSGSLLRDFGISFAFSLFFNFFFEVNSALGGRVLRDLVSGRYHRPRIERRLILFVDLVGSTMAAERVGPTRFLDYLAEFMADFADPVMATRGEIHKYVGDEVIVTWPAEDASASRAIACVFEFADRLRARGDAYVTAFGLAPAFRAGLHVGDLVVGEIGVWRREIAFLGDAMNVAARLVDTARAEAASFVASSEAVADIALPVGVIARPLGKQALRGRTTEIEVVALERKAA
ncbi:MAG: adenylate/guanylate cyclase domain-containing protein [Alphaproteobacteria bacterium]|nr:adenylate/guanylate cyclase domain-containing protein [Alphaproteobacteria bacterium]